MRKCNARALGIIRPTITNSK